MAPLDSEEKELRDSVEAGEWRSAPSSADDLERYRRYAVERPTLKDLLVAETPRCELPLPERGRRRRREPPEPE
jgi:hypothetical protein